MRVVQSCIVVLSFFWVPFASAGLCPVREPSADGRELQMVESDFTQERYEEALGYFDQRLPEILRDTDGLERRLGQSVFWISYRNGLTLIRGYVMRERALLLSDPVEKTAATDAFCQFVSRAEWLD